MNEPKDRCQKPFSSQAWSVCHKKQPNLGSLPILFDQTVTQRQTDVVQGFGRGKGFGLCEHGYDSERLETVNYRSIQGTRILTGCRDVRMSWTRGSAMSFVVRSRQVELTHLCRHPTQRLSRKCPKWVYGINLSRHAGPFSVITHGRLYCKRQLQRTGRFERKRSHQKDTIPSSRRATMGNR
jgi:hypothetical protein